MLYSALGNGVNLEDTQQQRELKKGREEKSCFLLIWKENLPLLSLWGEEYTSHSAFPTTALILTFNSPLSC